MTIDLDNSTNASLHEAGTRPPRTAVDTLVEQVAMRYNRFHLTDDATGVTTCWDFPQNKSC